MKKIVSAIIVAVALATAMPAQAQGLKFGVKGGLNLTSLNLDKVSDFSSAYEYGKENKAGWYIGPTVKYTFAMGLGFDGAVFYDQRNAKVNGEDVKQKTVYVPINLRYNIGIGALGSVYLAAGPQVGFNVGDTNINIGHLADSKDQINDTFQLKKATFGINLGAGLILMKHLEVGVVYNIPLGNTADIKGSVSDIANSMKDKYDVKSNTFQVSAAIYF